MTRLIEALYLTVAIAPLEVLFGLAYSNVGPIILYNIILAFVPLIFSLLLIKINIEMVRRGSIFLLFLSIIKIISLIYNTPPWLAGMIDSGIIIVMSTFPLAVGGNSWKVTSGLAIIGSILILFRLPGGVGVGLLLWTFSLVIAGFDFKEHYGDQDEL